MLVESGNPAHSLADTPAHARGAGGARPRRRHRRRDDRDGPRWRTTCCPRRRQFEKWEATFFNFDFPHNVFHLRKPVLAPPGRRAARAGDPRPPGRGARCASTDEQLAPLRGRCRAGPRRVRRRRSSRPLPPIRRSARWRRWCSIARSGPRCPTARHRPRILWGAAHRCALGFEASVRRAGFTGEGLAAGRDAVRRASSPATRRDVHRRRVGRRVATGADRRRAIHLVIPELVDELRGAGRRTSRSPPTSSRSCSSAGERRSFTANTIIRDAAWRKRDADGALRLSPADADALRASSTVGACESSPRRGAAAEWWSR